ncbi:hypothetical protein CENSYa_0647 [Cenarchaeum symbiosum A]|uniref:Uncharacterized protein n=1 Tax=Cenarchaeum symbiosum (strain A) TaxID=414004 RepID=A0RVB3_CENSY|nr:hypothetical protein CENSYa_0647 [Cenarchaeum symbiosum A]
MTESLLCEFRLTLSCGFQRRILARTRADTNQGCENPSGFLCHPQGATRMKAPSAGCILALSIAISLAISTPAYADPERTVLGPFAYVSDIVFSDDGLDAFASVTDPDAIYHYTLSSPYDTTWPVYSDSFRLEYGGSAVGMAFSGDGTDLFVARNGMEGVDAIQSGGAGPAFIHKYDLSSPFDISAPERGERFELPAPETGGIAFAPGGTVMFVSADNSIHRYELSSPYGLSNPVHDSSYGLNQTEFIWEIEFSDDGTGMFASEETGVHGYELGGPYNLDSMEYAGSFDTKEQPASGLAFSDGGTELFVAGESSMSRYALSEEYDITSARLEAPQGHLGQSAEITDEAFSPDGMIMLTITTGPDAIHRYDLASPYDTSSPVYTGSAGLKDGGAAYGMAASDDGAILFVSRNGNPGEGISIEQYELSAPYDITGPIHSGFFELKGGITESGGIVFVPGGTEMLISGDDSLQRYSLSAPYDITNPVHDGSYDLGEHSEVIWEIEFSDDGLLLFVAEEEEVHGYELGGPYDPALRGYMGSLDTEGQRASGLAFADEGAVMFVVGGDSVSRYELPDRYDIFADAATLPEEPGILDAIAEFFGSLLGL